MKQKAILQIIGLCVGLLSAGSIYAQSSTPNPEMFEKTARLISPKADANADKLELEKMKSENIKVFKSFSRQYKNASEIHSSTTADQHTFIYCKIDGIVSRILYNKNGKWQREVRTYSESDLPADIRDMVYGSYPRFSIFGVTEVNTAGKRAYLVNIEDKKSWKTIRVVDNEMDVYKEYAKH